MNVTDSVRLANRQGQARVPLAPAGSPASPPEGLAAIPVDSSGQPVVWTRSDAWVLAAVRLCGTADAPGTLFGLVAACDALHHLVVSRDELEHAVQLLLGAGLVTVSGLEFGVTLQGRAVVAAAVRSTLGTSRTRGAAAEARVEALFAALSDIPVEPVDWQIPGRAYESACLEYRHTMWTEHRRTDRRR